MKKLLRHLFVFSCCFTVTATQAELAEEHLLLVEQSLMADEMLNNGSALLAEEPSPFAEQYFEPAPTVDLRQWNLQNVDIRNVVEEVARATGKNFIIDPDLSGNVTLISSQAMTPDELYELFLSMLQVLGYSAVSADGAVKIVPDAQARQMGTFIATDSMPGVGDEVVARVINIQHVSSAQLVPVLRNLVSPEGHLAAYAPSNSLLVVDRADNASRLAAIVERLDLPEADGIDMMTLRYASASEVVQTLNALAAVRRQGDNAAPIVLSADDRSNSILLSGDKGRRLQMQAIIAQLDVTVPGEGNTEVIYLRYQKAEEMVPVLANIVDSYAATQVAAGGTVTQGAGSASAQAQPVAASVQVGGGYGADYDSGFRPFADRYAAGISVGGYGIQAEPNMNALILTAPPALMRNLKAVIAQLDVRRAQVMVEAIIVELTDTQLAELGVEWRGGGSLAGGTAMPMSNGLSPLDSYQATLDDGGSALPTSGMNVGFIRNGSIRFLLHALQSNSSVNILSTPSLVALDNAEAEIKVGNQIPFQIGEYATTDGSNTVTPFVTTEYREVGLSLRIKPQITQDESVVLQIEQKVDSVGVIVDDRPTTTNREVTTTVLVNDGDILVLGGLIQTEESDLTTKVPVLGDLPLFGNFFRGQSRSIDKTNLMIFLRPTILRDADKALEVTGSKYNWMRNQQILTEQNNYDRQVEVGAGQLPSWEPTEARLPMPFQFIDEQSKPDLIVTVNEFD